MQDHRLLPPEIWLEIFDWATYNPNIASDEYTPFQLVPIGREADTNLRVRATLCLVCRDWRTWATQSLYRDIQIKYDANGLHKTLSRGESAGKRYGDMVRYDSSCLNYWSVGLRECVMYHRFVEWFCRITAPSHVHIRP